MSAWLRRQWAKDPFIRERHRATDLVAAAVNGTAVNPVQQVRRPRRSESPWFGLLSLVGFFVVLAVARSAAPHVPDWGWTAFGAAVFGTALVLALRAGSPRRSAVPEPVPAVVATVVVDTPGPDPALVGRLILASLRMMGTFPATLFDPGPVSMPVTDRADAERIGALLTAAGATVHIEHPAGRR